MPLTEPLSTPLPESTPTPLRSHDGSYEAHTAHPGQVATGCSQVQVYELQHRDAPSGGRRTATAGALNLTQAQARPYAAQNPELHVSWNARSAASVRAQRREAARVLQLLADELLLEAAGQDSLQATRVLPRSVSGLRQTLIAVAGATRLDSPAAHPEGSLHMLRGTARLVADQASTELRTNDDVLLPAGAHAIHTDAAAVILQSVVVAPTGFQNWAATPDANAGEWTLGHQDDRSEALA